MKDGAPDTNIAAALGVFDSPVFTVDRLPDGDFHMTFMNDQYRKALALDAGRSFSGPLNQVMAPRTADLLSRHYAACLDHEGTLTFDAELEVDGGSSWWRITLTEVASPVEGTRRIAGIATEITDLMTSKTEVIGEFAALHDAYDEMRTIATLTAHDMRAPLANVVSLTEIALEGYEERGDGRRKIIEACGAVASHSLSQIDDMMSRAAGSQLSTAPPVEIDLGKVCTELLAIADPTHRLHTHFPDGTIAADEMILRLSLRNLIDNAVRYAASAISIRLEAYDAAGMLSVIVSDDGPGFAEGTDPIVEALDRRRRDDGRGFGLGAVIRLLRSRGGGLSVIGSGEGATVRMTLPGYACARKLARTA